MADSTSLEEVEFGVVADAKVAAGFYLQLVQSGVPQDVAKDLTIAYILKPPVFSQ